MENTVTALASTVNAASLWGVFNDAIPAGSLRFFQLDTIHIDCSCSFRQDFGRDRNIGGTGIGIGHLKPGPILIGGKGLRYDGSAGADGQICAGVGTCLDIGREGIGGAWLCRASSGGHITGGGRAVLRKLHGFGTEIGLCGTKG